MTTLKRSPEKMLWTARALLLVLDLGETQEHELSAGEKDRPCTSTNRPLQVEKGLVLQPGDIFARTAFSPNRPTGFVMYFAPFCVPGVPRAEATSVWVHHIVH